MDQIQRQRTLAMMILYQDWLYASMSNDLIRVNLKWFLNKYVGVNWIDWFLENIRGIPMKSFHITMNILHIRQFLFIFPHKKFVKSSWENGQISIKWFSLGQIDWSWMSYWYFLPSWLHEGLIITSLGFTFCGESLVSMFLQT